MAHLYEHAEVGASGPLCGGVLIEDHGNPAAAQKRQKAFALAERQLQLLLMKEQGRVPPTQDLQTIFLKNPNFLDLETSAGQERLQRSTLNLRSSWEDL